MKQDVDVQIVLVDNRSRNSRQNAMGRTVPRSRSISSDPSVVARLGCAILRGIQSEGVAACGKHFLGHGDTSQDSHHTLPRITHSIERLEQIELPPFKAAIDAGVSSIMTAHVVFDALDPKYPVTMSRKALDGISTRGMPPTI